VRRGGRGRPRRQQQSGPAPALAPTARRPRRRPATGGACRRRRDGTYHLLEDPPTRWPASGIVDSVDWFDAARPVRLGADDRQQVLAVTAIGANTTHHVALVVGADRRLRTVDAAGAGPVDLAEGGGAGYRSQIGCVTSKGAPLLATAGSTTKWDPNGGAPQYGWTRTYHRLDDTTLQEVGREGGWATVTQGPLAGGDCAAVDPGDRGPEIGVPGRAAVTDEQAAMEFLTAVLDDDRSGVSRLLAGTGVEDSWAGGRGSDAWVEARRATQDDRTSWRSARLRCGDVQTGAGLSRRTCVFERSGSDTGLFVQLQGSAEGWTVAGAVEWRVVA
jgi:hypothetical protein